MRIVMQNLKAKVRTKRHGKGCLQKKAVSHAQAIGPDKKHHYRHNRRHNKLGDILVIAVFDQALFNSAAIVKHKPVLNEKRHHEDSDNDEQQSNEFFLFHASNIQINYPKLYSKSEYLTGRNPRAPPK